MGYIVDTPYMAAYFSGLVKDMTFVVMLDLIIAILLSSAENYYCYLFVFHVRFHAHMYLLIRG
jgi:hypothetical protein